MATLDEISLLGGGGGLTGLRNTLTSTNPYGIAGATLAQWQPDMRTWDPATQGISSFAKAFAAGLLSRYAQQDTANQLNSVLNVLPQLRADPLSVATPEGVDEGAFATYKADEMMRQYAVKEQRAQTLSDLMQKVGLAGLTKKAEVLGENEAYAAMGQGGVVNPDSPAYKVGQDKITIERQLANDFANAATKFKAREQGLRALTEAFEDTSGTSDFEIIRRGAQAVEEGLAVRADDVASLEGAASALGMTYAAVEAAITGKTKLSPEVRAGIMRVAKRGYNSSFEDYNTIRENFIKRAAAAKLDELAVVPYGAAKPFEELYPKLDISAGLVPSAGAANVITAPDGKQIVITD